MTGAFHDGIREALGGEPVSRTPQEIAVLREHNIAQQRAVDEANEYIVSSDDSIIVGAIADLVSDHPHLFAIRFLRVERDIDELRRRVDAAQSGLRYEPVTP